MTQVTYSLIIGLADWAPHTTFPSATELIRHDAKRHRASSWCLAIIIWNTNVYQNIWRSIFENIETIAINVSLIQRRNSLYITYNLPTQSQSLKKPLINGAKRHVNCRNSMAMTKISCQISWCAIQFNSVKLARKFIHSWTSNRTLGDKRQSANDLQYLLYSRLMCIKPKLCLPHGSRASWVLLTTNKHV